MKSRSELVDSSTVFSHRLYYDVCDLPVQLSEVCSITFDCNRLVQRSSQLCGNLIFIFFVILIGAEYAQTLCRSSNTARYKATASSSAIETGLISYRVHYYLDLSANCLILISIVHITHTACSSRGSELGLNLLLLGRSLHSHT